MALAAVTGLAAEATIARRAGLRAAAAGGGGTRIASLIAGLIAEGANGLVSFGICGGLDPALASGSLLLPLAVREETGARLPVDRAWHAAVAAALAEAGIAAATGDLLGAAAPAATPERKRALHAGGAVAVDLESHFVAQAARAARLPFLVLRAVADPAARRLPPAALAGLDDEGHAALGPVLQSLWRQPAQLPALVQIACETKAALRALRRAAPLLGRVAIPASASLVN
ncbi:MAG TPA: nucleoside phosphorylase [Stellaceae bacterium]|nr:nucleoside phosphorylase [Stellaceae bacterium]